MKKNNLNQKKGQKRNKITGLILFTIIFFILVPIFNSIYFHPKIIEDSTSIKSASVVNHKEYLLINPTFNDPIEPIWYFTTEGDFSDIQAITSTNQAGFKIVGDSHVKQVLLNSETYSNWEAFNKSELALVPQRSSVPTYGIDSNGAWCSHLWWEGEPGGQPKNTPEMHWRTNVSLSVDMSDYIITSVSFEATINASVNDDIDTPGDTYARWTPSQVTINQHEKYDFAQFYVEITTMDIKDLNTYRIAFNQTRLLGNEALDLNDMEGLIGAYDEQAIIDALTNALAADPGHDNFTIVLGIYLYCEDNRSDTDRDDWTDLRFKSLNLTFNYEKRINQFTTVAWNQDVDDIDGTNVRITDANLKFKYKIDQNWTEASQNSQIRIFINDRKYEQTISLIDYVYSPNFREAKTDGYDIVSKILPYENFTLTIEVFLAEDFGLEQNITIAITDVYLHVSWTETFPDIIPEPWLFLGLFIIALIAAIVITGYLIAYQTYLKYPIPVRKVRKYGKTLNDLVNPKVPILPRDRAFKLKHRSYLKKTEKALKGALPKTKQIPDEIVKQKPEMQTSKTVESPGDKP